MTTKVASILIVEDEAIAAESIAGRLRQQGYMISGIVDSGAEAVQHALAKQPDLILMDIMLKGEIDGVTAAAKIYALAKIPVVYMTAFADETTLARAKATEPLGYLVKPFKPQELRATVEVALQKRATEAQMYLALEQLQKSNQQSETDCAIKSNFLSLISHELRTPLSTIYLSADMLEKNLHKLSPENQIKRLQHIKQAIEQISAFMTKATSIDKVTSKTLQPKPTNFNLANFCYELVEEMQLFAGEKYNIHFRSYGNCHEACTDANLLQHILTNLLTNAIKYSPQGGEISFELECLDLESKEIGKWEDEDVTVPFPHSTSNIYPGQVAIFRIQDHGIGITPEAQAHLFDAFHHSSDVDSVTGSSLGLAIVKRCIDVQGGAITFDSKVGVGTTFTVTLPLGCPVTNSPITN